jgi:hypothetical protein
MMKKLTLAAMKIQVPRTTSDTDSRARNSAVPRTASVMTIWIQAI